MKKILSFAVLLTLLSITIAFSASTEAPSSSSNTSSGFSKDEPDFESGSSDYFKIPVQPDMDESAPQNQMDQGQRGSRLQSRQEFDGSGDGQVGVDPGGEYAEGEDSEEKGELATEEGRERKDSAAKGVKQSQSRYKKSQPLAQKKSPPPAQKREDKAPVSPLERAMGENPVTVDRVKSQRYGIGQLTQFGYSFFKDQEDALSSQTDVPVGPEYVIGAGDRLIVTVWGSIEGTHRLEVNRSGEIVLPKVGAVKVAGQTFGQLPALLRNHISRIYKDFQLNVNMGKLRLIKVYVVGEVASPGDYNVNSLSTLIGALSAAGGPTKNGSLRNIQINRGGKVVENVDLYDFFLKGDQGKDIRLQPGDTILVPVIGKVAGVAGNVRRPAIYELKGESNLKELLALAGGINPTGYLNRVQIYRVQAHDKKMVSDVNLDLQGKSADEVTSGIVVHDLDVVKVLSIDSVLRGYVRLEGHVVRPGDYALTPGMRISSLLKPQSLLPEYHAASGQIIRLYPPDLHPEVVFFDLSRAMQGEAGHDLELREFDRVRVFAKREMEETPVVKVSGEVQKPGPVRYMENMTVRDLLMQAGNAKLSAYLKNAEITRLERSGGAVSSYSITVDLEKALAGGKENIKLQPFDELTVRRMPNWAEATERYVTLKGEFVFPGTYPISKGERLSSVIARAGGFTDLAYLKGSRFTRESARKLQQQRMDEALDKAQEDIIKLQTNMSQTASSAEEVASSKTTLDGLLRSVEILKSKKAEGRVLMELVSLEQLQGSIYDVELQGGDQLQVPGDPGGVNVIGDVYNQNTIVTQRGRDVEWYLDQVGGATGDADLDGVYVVKVDGSVISQANSSNFLFYNSFWGKQLDSGDTIIVPRHYEKTAWLRTAKDLAAILGNIAVTAGVLLAAGL